MASDYMPSSFPNLQTWFTGIKSGITTDGPNCQQSPTQVTADAAFVDTLLTAVTTANTKDTEAMEAHGNARTLLRQKKPELRALFARYRGATGWTEGMAAAWDIATHDKTYDMNTHAPIITAQAAPSRVRISGKKPGFTSATVQMRVEGTSNWTDIGVKLSHFPFDDTTAPQTPSKPEKREYRALGYIGDQQQGQPSDIVTAVFAG